MNKVFAAVATVLCLTTAGFAAGGFVAVLFWVKPADGLTAAATTTMYAVGGAAIGLVGALVALLRTANERRGRLAVVSGVVAVSVVGLVVGWMSITRAREHSLAAAPPDTLPPPLPLAGARDSLIALVAAPQELLERFETRETDYESKAITVYAQERDFYLVGLANGGRAWLRQREAGASHPIEQLLINRLNYLTGSWDMTVRDEPGTTAPPRTVVLPPPTQDPEFPARVLQFMRRPDGIWIQVEVFDRSPCDGNTPKTVTTGWVPLYGKDAKPTVWFYSRGC